MGWTLQQAKFMSFILHVIIATMVHVYHANAYFAFGNQTLYDL